MHRQRAGNRARSRCPAGTRSTGSRPCGQGAAWIGSCHDPQECVLRPVGRGYRGDQRFGLWRAANCAPASEEIGKVYAGRNGIIGALTEDLIDTSLESKAAIAALKHTPGAAFGSCRYKLKSIHEQRAQYERLIEVFRAHDIGFFLYNGGGNSQDTAYKVSQIGAELAYPIVCIGIPKTVDNDLPITDCSPGFGSAAKYVATSLREAAFDLAAMSRTSTKVFALEVMGRHAGWTTAACALAAEQEGDAPHVLLLPEVAFNEEQFLAKVEEAWSDMATALSPCRKGSRDRTASSFRRRA